jgi:hypothetical protein
MTTAVDAGCYIFGIVPAGSPLPPADESGPAADLQLVGSGAIAALVGRRPPPGPRAGAPHRPPHDRVLADVVRAGTPVLPMRFGAVVADQQAVLTELLEPHQSEFEEALAALRGRVQYTVKVRYDEEPVLREVIEAHPEIRRLHGRTDEASRMRLGELVVRALEQRRPAAASAILTELMGTVDVRVREVAAPDEVLDAAFLVDADRGAEFEGLVEQVAERHAGRMQFRLVGPSAAYDFVGDQ